MKPFVPLTLALSLQASGDKKALPPQDKGGNGGAIPVRFFTACVFAMISLFFHPPTGAAAVPVTVVDVQGESHAGNLAALTSAEVTVSINNQPRTFRTQEVLEIQFEHERMSPYLAGAAIFLANGDRLVARPETIDETAALARWVTFPAWKSVKVPLETMTGFILEIPEIAAVRSEALQTVMDRRQKADLVDLKNGDQASGEFLGLTDKSLRLDTAVGETVIERGSIRLVTMNRELISFPPREGQAMLLSLTDGSLLTVTDLKREGEERLAAKTLFGADLDLPITALMSVRCLGGRAVYLGDLTLTRYEHKPYLAGAWELKTGKNVLGEPLYLDGTEYPKGLGMHSQSSVTYNLDGEYQTFRATIGIDDAADDRGSAVFIVEVDGKEAYRGDPQTARHPAIELPPISVAGAKQLTLKVEFGPFGDVLDYADWCDPILIKAKPD